MTEQSEIEILLSEEKLLTHEIENLEERLSLYKHNLAEVKYRVNALKAKFFDIIN